MCWYVLGIITFCLHFMLLFQDINECTLNPDICGLGTCFAIDDEIYECTCQDGAMEIGDGTNNTLTCVGMSSMNSIVCVLVCHE